MNRIVLISALSVPGLLLGQLGSRTDAFREPGAIYLEDHLETLPNVTVSENVALFVNLRDSHSMGTMLAGTPVQLQAATVDGRLRVRGRAAHGDVVGWISGDAVDGLDEEFLQRLKASEERRLVVADLIANQQVVIGMTMPEVGESLGTPQRVASREDAQGRREIWEYITYKRVPERQVSRDPRTGRLISHTIYVQVPVGSRTIIFANSVVEAIEADEEILAPPTVTRVVPPLTLVW
ncbi:MAG: hypothetical protein ACFCU3_07380 [Verrucomicrobiales bacterium]